MGTPVRAARFTSLMAVAVGLLGAACLGAATSSSPIPAPDDAPPTSAPTFSPTPTVTASPVAPAHVDAGPFSIAYVGVDNNIWLIKSDGTDSVRVTQPRVQAQVVSLTSQIASDIRYTWPTWSPTGDRLPFSGIELGPGGGLQTSLYIARSEGTELEVLYQSASDGFVAAQSPHYIYWAPDGRSVAFLAAQSAGLTLLVGEVDPPGEVRVIAQGAPLYFSWVNDEGSLLLHVGDALLTSSRGGAPQRLGAESARYRVPGSSADGGRIAFLAPTSRSAAGLYTADAQGRGRRLALETPDGAAFLWSPTRPELAVASGSAEALPFYDDGLVIINVRDQSRRRVTSDPVLAFFWSPDGQKIAYVTPEAGGAWLRLTVALVGSDIRKEIISFIPAPGLSTVLGFFDQYALSTSLWSPDSRYLVLTGLVSSIDGGVSPPAPVTSQVYLVDTTGLESPRRLAAGDYASFRPTIP